MSTIICLDPGTAHTGIAISEEGVLVTPVGTVFEHSLDKLVGRLTPYLARFHPTKIVIGQPSHGPLVDFSQKLGQKLGQIFSGEIVYFNEDDTSRLAKRTMLDQKKNINRRKKEEHQTAAAIILENYLDLYSESI